MSDRRQSVSFSTPPNRDRSVSYTNTSPSRERTSSLSVPHDIKRNHSFSVTSVDSAMSEHFQDDSKSKGKIYLMDNIDLEKQLIMTAGGKRENVMCFLIKLLFLTFVVLGSCVLVFYAL